MGELIHAELVPSVETIPAVVADIVSAPVYCGATCLCSHLGAGRACQPAFGLLSAEDAQHLHTMHGRLGDPLAWLLLPQDQHRPAALATLAGVLCVPMTIIRRVIQPYYLVGPTLDAARAMLPAGLGQLTLSIFAAATGSPEVWF